MGWRRYSESITELEKVLSATERYVDLTSYLGDAISRLPARASSIRRKAWHVYQALLSLWRYNEEVLKRHRLVCSPWVQSRQGTSFQKRERYEVQLERCEMDPKAGFHSSRSATHFTRCLLGVLLRAPAPKGA